MTITVTHAFTSNIADDPKAAAAGEVLPSHWNAAHVVTGGSGRTILTANTTVYVSTTGSDSNDGLTPATAWATMQHAFVATAQNYDLNGWILTIQLEDGTYDGCWINQYPIGMGVYRIQGNALDNTAVTVTSTFTGFACFEIDQANAFLIIKNITIQPGNDGVAAIEGDAPLLTLYVVNVNFKYTAAGAAYGLLMDNSNCVTFFGYEDLILLPDGSFDGGNYIGCQISGTWYSFLTGFGDMSEFFIGGNIQLVGTPVWNNAFFGAYGSFNSVILQGFAGETTFFTGSASGPRVQLTGTNSVTSTRFGASPQGINWLPGSSLGQVCALAGFDALPLLQQIATVPTTTQLFYNQAWGMFKNTGSGAVYLAANDGGTIKTVQLTT